MEYQAPPPQAPSPPQALKYRHRIAASRWSWPLRTTSGGSGSAAPAAIIIPSALVAQFDPDLEGDGPDHRAGSSERPPW